MKENVEIGVVVINYSENGSVLSTEFTPTLKVEGDQQLIDLLQSIDGTKDEESIKKNADVVFAQWFNDMNQIELSDRNEYQIVSELMHCDRYENNAVKTCSIKYTFKKI